MEPIYIILYAVLLTLLLTVALPRLRYVSPSVKRFLWIASVVGLLLLALTLGGLALFR